jgi:uncharacterized membrane protein
MTMIKNLSVVLALLLTMKGTLSFTGPSTLLGVRHLGKSNAQPTFDLSAAVAGLEEKNNNQREVIMREFERKEEKLDKQRTEAMAKLSMYEETLEKLKSTKAQYIAASQMADTPEGGTFSETTARSAVKALCWRIIAGSVTFATTLRFSGSMSMALQVVMGDFFSKAVTMFIGERLMNKSQAGRKTGGDAAGRSLAKALIWRLFAICNTMTMAIFISKDLSIASKIASTDAVFKTGLMFAYERVWARIQWGNERVWARIQWGKEYAI